MLSLSVKQALSSLVISTLLLTSINSNASGFQCIKLYDKSYTLAPAAVAEYLRILNSTQIASYAKASAFIAADMKEIFELESMPNSDAKKNRRRAYYMKDDKGAVATSIAVTSWLASIYTATNIFGGYAHDPKMLIAGAIAIPPVLFLADFFGAATHKAFDSYVPENNNLLGSATRQFRIHHEYPISLNDASYINHVSGPSLVMAPFLAATTAFAAFNHLDPVVGTAALVFTLTLMHSMEIHRRAHMVNPGYFAEILQKARFILRRDQHMKHHSGDRDDNFQVVNGWTEPSFERTNLWKRLDDLWWKYTKRMPHNWVQEPSSISDTVFEQLIGNPNLISPDMKPMMETFPRRANEKSVALIEARRAWEVNYPQERKQMYTDLAEKVGHEAAESLWIKEQKMHPGIFGKIPQPL